MTKFQVLGMRVLAACCMAVACRDERLPDATLGFEREGTLVRTLSFEEMAEHGEPEIVETDDPYYRAHKKFRAMRLEPIVEAAFGARAAVLRKETFVLRAADGYTVPIDGSRLLEGGAYLAFDDIDVPGFAPIGPQQVSPAPAYLVWTDPDQENLDTHPRPWQLATIEIARFEALYPHTVPEGEPPDSRAHEGFRLFRERCIRCHAINREGGRVGPDLNVPQSIVEYRPETQIRAYIRDPMQFRYGAMPAHPDLREAQLGALIAYFEAMAQRKHDPGLQEAPR